VPKQNVEELRQLVDAERTEIATERRDPRVATIFEDQAA
jgi:hypothetical protein